MHSLSLSENRALGIQPLEVQFPETATRRHHSGCLGARLALAQGQFICKLGFVFVLFRFTVFKALSYLKIEFPPDCCCPELRLRLASRSTL